MKLNQKGKLIRIVCLILSLILFFTNWVVTSGNSQYDLSYYGNSINNAFSSAQYLLGMAGVNYNTNKIRSITNCLINGKLTPAEILILTVRLVPMIIKLEKIEFLKGYLGNVTLILIALILLSIIIVISFIAGISALISVIKSSRDTKSKFYFRQVLILNIVLLAVVIILRLQDIKISLLLSFWAFLTIGLSYPFKALYDRKNSSVSVNESAGASGGFKFGSIDTEKLKDDVIKIRENVKNSNAYTQISDNANLLKKSVKRKIMHAAENVSWRCPSCGNLNGSENKFCSQCGCKKPEKPKCPNCGKEITDDSPFCSSCGTRIIMAEKEVNRRNYTSASSKSLNNDDFDDFLADMDFDNLLTENEEKKFFETELPTLNLYSCPVCNGELYYKQEVCKKCNSKIRWD